MSLVHQSYLLFIGLSSSFLWGFAGQRVLVYQLFLVCQFWQHLAVGLAGQRVQVSWLG